MTSLINKGQELGLSAESPVEHIRLLHVDEHTLLRDLLATQVAQTYGLELVGSTGDAEEALRVVRLCSPDIVLTEARLNGEGMSASEMAEQIYHARPEARIIVLSAHLYPAYVHELNRAGVKGYLLKTESWAEILRAVRAIHNGAFVASPDVAQILLSDRDTGRRAHTMLNPAECSLMSFVAEGMSNNEIAVRMNVSESTVRSRIGRTLAKLGAGTRTQAVTEAIRRGFVVIE